MDTFEEIIEMRGTNPMLPTKLHKLIKYIGYNFQRFSQDFYNRNYFDEMIEVRVNNPMLTSELHILLNILAPC